MILAEYLKQEDMRATAFADLIGVHPSTVARWIKGERYPRPEQFIIISQITNGLVTANDFYAPGWVGSAGDLPNAEAAG